MAILIGGIVAIIVGVILGAIWWSPVLSIIGGGLPILLLLGGGIAIYLGIDELRYPTTRAYPAAEPEKEKPAAGAPEPAVAPSVEEKKIQYWLIGYSARNLGLVREHGIIAVPDERSEVVERMMNIGDRVVLYALSPEAQFGGIVEIASESSRLAEMPLVPPKKGEKWECRREVRPVAFPPVDKWVDARPLMDELELLEEARKAGKTLARSFAAKLREIPQLSDEDYNRIARALGA